MCSSEEELAQRFWEVGSFPCSWREALKKLGGEKWLDVYDEPVVNTHQGDWRGREQTTTEPARGSECSAVLSELHRTLKDRGMLS